MKIFDSATIRELDKATCEAQNITPLELMDRAANCIACEIISRFLPSKRFVVVAGPGNNGGDALGAARLLIEQGYKRMEIFLFNVRGELSPECAAQAERLRQMDGVEFTEITRKFDPPMLTPDDVVIDGLFGSGISQPLQQGFMVLAKLISGSGAYVVSIDVPSGLFGEWNALVKRADMVHANLTLALQMPRLSFFFPENQDVIGEWKVIDIDLDVEAMRAAPTNYMLVDARSVRPLLRPRVLFSGKRDYGSTLLMCGSMGMMGAAVMCARAAMKSGVGLATVHTASCGMAVLQTAVPEAMFEPDRNEWFISDMTCYHNHQSVAVGPGIGTHEKTVAALESLLKNVKSPLVLDADALNCIARRPSMLSLLPPNTIITPHVGEFDRLFGEQPNSEARLQKAIEMANYYNIYIVLKGHYTATVRPTGKVYFNSTGNPGMATAGSGDVLTGIIASMLAQGYRPHHAATIGVYVHGLAGDLAARELGEVGITASDVANYVGRAVRSVMEQKRIS